MRKEKYNISSFWDMRKESLGVCAAHINHLLDCIKECDPLFERWYTVIGGDPGKEIRIQVDTNVIKQRLYQGQVIADYSGEIFESAGYSISLYSTRQNMISLRIHCGAYSPQLSNSCVFVIPADTAFVFNAASLLNIVQCILEVWKPDTLFVESNHYRNHLFKKYGKSKSRLGWITYIKAKSIPELPDGVSVIPALQGKLILLKNERFSGLNNDDVELADQVWEILVRESVLP